MTEDRLSWHLDNWAQWMGKRASTNGYPSRSMVIGKSNSSDFDTMVANADIRCAVAVDTIVDDLSARERAAVYHRHLAAVWRIRGDMEECYEDARMTLRIGLNKRGIL